MGKKMKTSAILSMIGMLLLSVIGCSSGNSSTKPTATAAASTATQASAAPTKDAKKPVTMRMSWWGSESRHKATLKAIEVYQSKNPNVKIEGEYGGFDGYLEKLTTQLAARTAPDIMQIDIGFLDQFTKQQDLFVDLRSKSQLDITGYDAGFLKGLSTPQGKLIGAPTGINSSTFIINKTVADKAGIDYSKQLTWGRLLEEGKKLHDANKEMYLLNLPIITDIVSFLFEPYLLNLTGNKLINDDYTVGFDRDSLIKTYTYINKLYESGVLQPMAETINLKNVWENPKWLKNELVGIMIWNAFYVPIKNSLPNSQLVTVDFPSTKGAKNTGVNIRPTNMLAINANSKAQDEAAKFINWFLNDPEAVKILGIERSIPAVESARKVLLDAGAVDQPFDNSVKYAMANQGISQSFVALNGEIQKIETDALQKVVYKDWTPDKAADEFIKRMTDKLAELKAKSGVK